MVGRGGRGMSVLIKASHIALYSRFQISQRYEQNKLEKNVVVRIRSLYSPLKVSPVTRKCKDESTIPGIGG